MKSIYFLLLVLLTFVGNAQEQLMVSDYDWEDVPDYSFQPEDDASMMAFKEQYITEFAFSKDNDFTEYYLEHIALWLNSNDKIEAHNKVYLPYASKSEFLKSKARVITASGQIIDLDDSKILSAQDEETGKNYTYFAFEGVEKGSVIEYLYLVKKKPSYNGTAFRLQSNYAKKEVNFDLYAPSNLEFQFKSYNGLPAVVKDTLVKDRLHWSLGIKDLEMLKQEEEAPYAASRGYFVYKLDRNTRTNKRDLSSYGSVAQNIYNFYYNEPSKKAKTLIEQLVRSIDSQNDSLASQLRDVDHLIKSTFTLANSGGENLKDLEQILVKNVASTTGMIKLYVAVLSHLEIKHEMVLTSNRSRLKFDKDFEAHNFLADFLIYFPALGTYLSPTDMESRYGFPPGYLTDNHGLFIKEVKIGSFKSGIGKVKYINAPDADKTTDKLVVNVRFDAENLLSNSFEIERSISGYNALPIHPYMHLIVGEDRENILKELAKNMSENVDVDRIDVINEDPKLFGVKPIKFVMDLKSEAFIEKAGKKYLFNVGALIGPQKQMYQDKKRILPLESRYKRSYYREINIQLPKGFTVVNLEELKIKNSYANDGKELFSFVSSYALVGDQLKVTVVEYYDTNIVPPSIFEAYRKVINSAADFNKITLILEPKEL